MEPKQTLEQKFIGNDKRVGKDKAESFANIAYRELNEYVEKHCSHEDWLIIMTHAEMLAKYLLLYK